MNYSRRNLTYQADRFIALSGIAERIQQQTKDEYFAGMWCNKLIWQLCWKVYGHDVGRRISPPQAPTWSWASLASPISIYERDRTQDFPLSKVLKVEKPHTKHQFGDMPSVALWLSCPPLLLAQVNTPYTMVFGGTSALYRWFRMDCVTDTLLVNMNSEICTSYILQLFDGEGLILKPVEGKRGVYERIGHIFLSYREFDANDEDNHAEESAYVPREEHNFETNEHVICLV